MTKGANLVSAITYKIIHNHENFTYIVFKVISCFYFELFDMFKSEGGQFQISLIFYCPNFAVRFRNPSTGSSFYTNIGNDYMRKEII